MKTGLTMNHQRHVEMFECINAMIGGFVQLATSQCTMPLGELNSRMKAGTVFRMTASVGYGGSLGVLVQGVRPDGSVFDVVTLDAPPRDQPFQFTEELAR